MECAYQNNSNECVLLSMENSAAETFVINLPTQDFDKKKLTRGPFEKMLRTK